MTPGQGQGPDSPLDHVRAETYLRLLTEAELRRVEALPRPDPLAEIGVPGPLRGPVRLAMPLGQRALTAVQPLAETAARTIQPAAETAARTIQPLASQLAGAVRPAAERAARTLHPLVWQAAGRLQELRSSGGHLLRMVRSRATAPLTRVTGHQPLRHEKRSPEDGVRRIANVAHALVWVGAVDTGTADSIMASMATALVARSRAHPHRLLFRLRNAGPRQGHAGPPAGTYLAAPVGVLVPFDPEGSLRDVYVMSVVIAPDRAVLTVTGRLAEPDSLPPHLDPWPTLGGPGCPVSLDDRGNRYELRKDSAWSDADGTWSGTASIAPVPPAGTQWLDLTMRPGSAPIRVDLAGASGDPAAGPERAASPAESLVDSAAMRLLDAATGVEAECSPAHDLSQVADVVIALDAVGALTPARAAVGRLVTLAGRLGVDVPPALGAAGSPCALPEAWVSVLENSRRHDGPRGVAPAVAVLPELDGTQFVLAGLLSTAAGGKLDALAWGDHRMSGVPWRGRDAWSWTARDDHGRWHILTAGSFSASDMHARLQLNLKPPLHPDATSLEVHVAGRSGEVTATVPLDWREC
jgi:hypothetical protein